MGGGGESVLSMLDCPVCRAIHRFRDSAHEKSVGALIDSGRKSFNFVAAIFKEAYAASAADATFVAHMNGEHQRWEKTLAELRADLRVRQERRSVVQ